jgi:hypothetical protein
MISSNQVQQKLVDKTRDEQPNDLPYTIRQAEITDIRKVYPAINKGDCLN